MLTKVFQRTFIPGVPARPEVPYRPAFTVCQQSPAPGHWETTCTRMNVQANGSIRIPPGGELVTVYDPNGAIDPLTGQVKVIDVYIRVCSSKWVADGPPGPTVCTSYPEQPHVPAFPGAPARVEVSTQLGWDAGANSVVSHEGDCVCTFNMDRVAGAVCGFTADLDDVTAIDRLTHALYFHGGKFQVVESGKARTPDAGYTSGDEFKIQRAAGEVSYLHSGKRIYTSRAGSFGEIHVGGALYASADTIGGSHSAPTPNIAGAVTYYYGSGARKFIAADVGLSVPDFSEPQVVNLFDLVGATYTLANVNGCGDAVAFSLAGGILSTQGTQSAGSCGYPSWPGALALTIHGGSIPFDAYAESLYAGRLLKDSFGSGVSNASPPMVQLVVCAPYDFGPYDVGSIRYFSETPANIDSNSGTVDDVFGVGEMAAALEGDGLQIHVSADNNSTYKFSTDLKLMVPPMMPTRFHAVIEEHWPAADFEDLGELEFPATGGEEDGATAVPIRCLATGPTWQNPDPVIDPEQMELSYEELSNVFDSARGYRLGIYSGSEGYVDMVRVGTLKLLPGAGGGGG